MGLKVQWRTCVVLGAGIWSLVFGTLSLRNSLENHIRPGPWCSTNFSLFELDVFPQTRTVEPAFFDMLAPHLDQSVIWNASTQFAARQWQEVITRLQSGDCLHFAVLGGSVSVRSGPNTTEVWPDFFRAWLHTRSCKRGNETQHTVLNLAKGGCGSTCHQQYLPLYLQTLEEQRVKQNPIDVIIFENTVNDPPDWGKSRHGLLLQEAVIRSLFNADCKLAIVMLSASLMNYDTNCTTMFEHALVPVFSHYGIPIVSFPRAIFELHLQHLNNVSHLLYHRWGFNTDARIFFDRVHMTFEGHALVAGVLASFLTHSCAQRSAETHSKPCVLEAPLNSSAVRFGVSLSDIEFFDLQRDQLTSEFRSFVVSMKGWEHTRDHGKYGLRTTGLQPNELILNTSKSNVGFGFLRSYENMGVLEVTPIDPSIRFEWCTQKWFDPSLDNLPLFQKLKPDPVKVCRFDGLGLGKVSLFANDAVTLNHPGLLKFSVIANAKDSVRHDHRFVLYTIAFTN